MIGIPEVDAAIQATEEWLAYFDRRLAWRDRNHAYTALVAGLHALRDCLPADEAAYVRRVPSGAVARLLFRRLASDPPSSVAQDTQRISATHP